VSGLLASIPSPSGGEISLGPISIHAYGLMLLLAIAAAVWLSGLRWTRRGGDWDLVFRVAVWGVAAGIVGARAYHVLTSWDEVPDEWWGVFAVWEGGLGVWGGVFCDLIGVGLLLLIDRRFRIRPPGLFALYVAWYTAFRSYEETLRIDPATEYFGLRLNFYVSVGLFVLSIGFFLW